MVCMNILCKTDGKRTDGRSQTKGKCERTRLLASALCRAHRKTFFPLEGLLRRVSKTLHFVFENYSDVKENVLFA